MRSVSAARGSETSNRIIWSGHTFIGCSLIFPHRVKAERAPRLFRLGSTTVHCTVIHWGVWPSGHCAVGIDEGGSPSGSVRGMQMLLMVN